MPKPSEKGKGKGWHKQPKKHSEAALLGHRRKNALLPNRDIIVHPSGKKSYAVRRTDGTFADIQSKERADSQDRLKANQHRYKYGADKQSPKQYYTKQRKRGLGDSQILDDLEEQLDIAKVGGAKKSWIRRLLERIKFTKSQQKIRTGMYSEPQDKIAIPEVSIPQNMSPKDFNARLDKQGLTKVQKIAAIERAQRAGRGLLKDGKKVAPIDATGKIGKYRPITERERKQLISSNQKLGRYKAYIKNRT